ncbi:hypothetical protein [Pararhodobacter zhoushanensis]|uniref:Uncharacterized protein n=1 Tax=Pararhodobacter zhoushanensis TaxID=2479545 RepID=A0ABT3GWD1_9RHOB|nr:hypothetical protein [Pararhodobacter zhoushanensis]MCW1931824.1 hypothetical protein [Pararhodobacter zhoushanensis]
MEHQKIVNIELNFEREVARSRGLSLFRRNPTTWELLLLLARYKNGSNEGVYNTIDSVGTRYLGNSALLKFIRERRDDGLVQFLEHEKKSKWTLQLNEELVAQLIELLDTRNRQLLRAAAEENVPFQWAR